jgi:CRP-like cAMP-binding protein
MFERLKKYLDGRAALTADELARVQALAVPRFYRKKQYLLKEGEVCRLHTFVCQGCLRIFRVGPDGADHIIKFAVEDWWVSDQESLLSGQPAVSNIDALEDSEVLQWTRENYDLLLAEIPAFRTFYNQMMARALEASTNRIYENISLTAEERYHQFIRRYPGTFNRVPLYMVASYLGVARETLTRIRIQHTDPDTARNGFRDNRSRRTFEE